MKVHLGCLHHSFYEVAARVVAAEIEAAGHEVVLHQGAHAELYPRLAAGDLQFMIASWLPHLHQPFYEPVQDKLALITPVFDGGGGFWAVPACVPADAVGTVADLAKPEVAEHMDRGILAPRGAIAICDRAEVCMDAYGLSDAGYTFTRLDGDEEWSEGVKAKCADGIWFTTTLWQPHFLNTVVEMRRLDEPEAHMGGPDTAWLSANKAFADTAPADLMAAFERIRIGLSGITEMDVLVNVEGLTPTDAAQRWRADRADG